MKKFLAFLAACSALFLGVNAAGQQRNNTGDKSLLWRISGKNITKSSYLFGTMHLICRDDFVWTTKMNESLAESDKVCFEMDLHDPKVMEETSAGILQVIMKKMQQSMSAEQMQTLMAMLQDSLGSGNAGLPDLRSMATFGLKCSDAVSYEDSIMTLALNRHKQITGLEQPVEQLEILNTLPIDSLLGMLLGGDLPGEESAENADLTKAYKSQDLPALYELITKTPDPSMDMTVFLDKRNVKWIPRMTDKMNTSSVFFAVGAGHLYGPNGVISLLRKAGYTVEPIK